MLAYDFMRRAFIVGTLLAIIIPMIGVIMINRKTSMIGDALSHTSLAGIGIGLILGQNPVRWSLIICVIAAFATEIIRKKFKEYGDMATAIIMSTGIGLAAILSDFSPGGTSFESYLFGSITTLTKVDLYMAIAVSLAVIFISLYLYWALLYISIDPDMARLVGVKVDLISGIFTFLTAITVAISAKMVGALMVTSLMVIPVATSLLIGRSYKQTYFLSIIFAIISLLSGIILSYNYGIKTGGATVVLAVIGLVLVSALSYFYKKIIKNKKDAK
ncbi:MAG: metal ABC transporter permease [Peptoniphilaceae bacterium]|nr:metal ABC transporter permease [Peptoniphilaceae bacterium]MDY6019241.1 metal ABC transporter permease [Anaerococcus sp.]